LLYSTTTEICYEKALPLNNKNQKENRSMSFYDRYGPKLSVKELKAKADKFVAKLKQKAAIFPVQLEGKQIATTFWGKSWCQNLESYQDYANRLDRGRSYVRHGAVVDLQIKRGQINAQVIGSKPYKIEIQIAALPEERWAALCKECSGKVGSLMELLQGKLSKDVMSVLCQRPNGIFPTPKEIEFSCSCPDFASMCKHIAATLYGVGHRLDQDPSLFFLLRSVDEKELLGKASIDGLLDTTLQQNRHLSEDLGELFGVDFVTNKAPAKITAKPTPKTKAKPKSQTKPKKAVTKLTSSPKKAEKKALTKKTPTKKAKK
jgi:uncharacterized Zn finger protein